MATGKRYYWIKLKESFMTSDTVDFLMSQENGAQYVVLYQMLCLKTINTEGRLSRTIGEIVIPYDVTKIQRDCKWFSGDTIRVALDLYKRFGLIYEEQDGTLVLTNHDSIVGSETNWAEQKRLQRSERPELPEGGQCPPDVRENVHPDIRDKILDTRDKILEIREERLDSVGTDKPTRARKRKAQNIPPSLDEVRAYIAEKGYNIDPEHFVDYYAVRGWKTKTGPIQDWQACVRTWVRNDRKRQEEATAAPTRDYSDELPY